MCVQSKDCQAPTFLGVARLTVVEAFFAGALGLPARTFFVGAAFLVVAGFGAVDFFVGVALVVVALEAREVLLAGAFAVDLVAVVFALAAGFFAAADLVVEALAVLFVDAFAFVGLFCDV